VEGGVEDDGLGDIGEHFAHGVDAGEVAGGVERGEVFEAFDLLDDLIGDEGAVLEDFAAVSDAVTDGADFLEVADDTQLGVGEGVEDDFDAFGMVGDGELLVVFLALVFVSELTHFQAYTFKKTFSHDFGIVGHVD